MAVYIEAYNKCQFLVVVCCALKSHSQFSGACG